jgi:hypothetical protein
MQPLARDWLGRRKVAHGSLIFGDKAVEVARALKRDMPRVSLAAEVPSRAPPPVIIDVFCVDAGGKVSEGHGSP